MSSLDSVMSAFRTAFAEELVLKSHAILMPLGYSLEEFKADGLKQLGPEAFARILYDIQQQQIDIEFLVAGFEKDEPYIFTVKSPGKIDHYQEIGFWAIGSGQTAALGSLFNQKFQVRFLEEEGAIYRVLEAKFNAENAVGVGPRTVLFIIRPDGTRIIPKTEDVESVRSAWDKTRTKLVPPEGIDKVKSLLAQARTVTPSMQILGNKPAPAAL
jgi:hypothetical protein